MNRDNTTKKFQIYPWGKKIDEEVRKYLGKRKTGGRIRDTSSWEVDSTQEHQASTEESRNHHQVVLSHPHGSS
jgi:hypothetical protein